MIASWMAREVLAREICSSVDRNTDQVDKELCCQLVAALQSTQTTIYSQLTALKLSDSIFLWKGEVQYLDAGGKILPDLKSSYQSPGSLQP